MIRQPVIETIFPTTVLLNNIDRSFTKEELNFCYNNFKVNAGTSYMGLGNKLSDDHRILEKQELSSLRLFMEQNLEFYFRNIICAQPEAKLFITHSFLNYMKQGEGHSSHVHPNSYLSAVMYISADKQKDKICFSKSPRGDYPIRVDSTNQNMYNTSDASLPVGTGDLIIFPSSLVHGVTPKEEDNLRISLVCNTFIKGTVGNNSEYTDLYL